MKKFNYILCGILFCTLIVVGCSNNTIETSDVYIKVEKRMGVSDDFELINEVEEEEEVQRVQEISKNAQWENMKPDKNNLPDYQFHIVSNDPKVDIKPVLYSLWIRSDRKKVELFRAENDYVTLNEKDSAELFELLIGSKLSE